MLEDSSPNAQINKSLIVGEQNVQPDPSNDKKGVIKVGQYCESIYQIEQLGGNKISNSILKAFILFFLYLSYALLLAAIILIAISGETQRQNIINYLTEDNNVPYIFVLILLGIIIIILYQNFTKNSSLEPKVRKLINFFIDWFRIAFHLVFLIFIQPFINEQQKNGLVIAFWLLVTGEIVFILRSLLKWIHFYCGTGKQNMEIWQKIFKMDEKQFQKHFKQLKEIKDGVDTLLKSQSVK